MTATRLSASLLDDLRETVDIGLHVGIFQQKSLCDDGSVIIAAPLNSRMISSIREFSSDCSAITE